jgi:hypothetical protein
MKRILAAVAPAALPAIRGALVNKVVVLPAHTLDDACQVLVSRVDMIIAGVHFDDSRMFDLLRIAKADPTYRDIPFLCIRGVSGPIAPGWQPHRPRPVQLRNHRHRQRNGGGHRKSDRLETTASDAPIPGR